MTFRPLIGYLLLEGITIAHTVFIIQWVLFLEILPLYGGGLLIGIIAGHLSARRVRGHIEQKLIRGAEISTANSKELLGPQPYRWLIFIFFIFPFLPVPTEGYELALSINTLLIGVLNGLVAVYFLFLIMWSFLKERELGGKLTITIL